jgi:hypothetical protein
VQAMSVAEVADELYALSPAEFTAARDERARQARAAGQRDEAAAIKKLARPTASAWLVNQLARTAPDQIARLIAVGKALEEAQRNLVGERLRELSTERRQVINELLPHATEIARQAGQPASQGTMGEVRATLEAALADARARAAVQSGRLTKALAYAGIGDVDLSDALALPADQEQAAGTQRAAEGEAAATAPAAQSSAVKTPGPKTPAAKTPEQSAALAAEALAAAQAAADDAERALETADWQLAGVAEQRQFLRRRVAHLERELGQAKVEDAELARNARKAQRDRDAAARALQGAVRRLGQAQKRAAGSRSR